MPPALPASPQGHRGDKNVTRLGVRHASRDQAKIVADLDERLEEDALLRVAVMLVGPDEQRSSAGEGLTTCGVPGVLFAELVALTMRQRDVW